MTQRSRAQELIDELDADHHLAELLSERLSVRRPSDMEFRFEARFEEHISRLDNLVGGVRQANRNRGARMDRLTSAIGGLKGY